MNILEVVKQPVNLVFLVFVVVLFILGKVIRSINQYLTIIVTIVWFIFSFFGYSNDSGYTTIWFAGTLTWLIWLLEASKTQSDS